MAVKKIVFQRLKKDTVGCFYNLEGMGKIIVLPNFKCKLGKIYDCRITLVASQIVFRNERYNVAMADIYR